MKEVTNCPYCKSSNIDILLKTKDYLVSDQYFNIVKCNKCNLFFTSPKPTEEEIAFYYKSDDYAPHTTSSKGMINKLYKIVRQYNLFKKLKIVNRLNKNNKSKHYLI